MSTTRITRVQTRKARGEKIRVIIYNRVSGNAQEEDGTSLETQREDCIKYAQENGYVIVDIIDETYTGFELEQRAKFMKVMKRCKEEEADAIIFRTYDRLSRNRTHFTVIAYDAQKYGYELFCVKESFDTEDIYASILRDIVGIFAELERYKIHERTSQGVRKRAESGKLLTGSRALYGYNFADNKRTRYAINDHDAAVVQRIDTLYLQGYSQQSIAAILTKENIPSPTGKKVWNRSTITDMLETTEYHGEGYAYKWKTVINQYGRKQNAHRNVSEYIPMPTELYPLIRTIETYNAIQERRKNAHTTTINSKMPKEILLRGGFIRCSICGRNMNCNTGNGGRIRVYICKNPENNKGVRRHSLQISALRIEDAVIKYVTELLKDLSVIEHALLDYIANHSSQTSVDAYDNAIEQIRSRQNELAKELKSTKGYARELLIGQLNELEEGTEKLQKYKENIMGEDGKWSNLIREINDVIEWIRIGNVKMEDATFEEKKRILKALKIVVYVFPGGKEENKRIRTNYEIQVGMLTLDTTSKRSDHWV